MKCQVLLSPGRNHRPDAVRDDDPAKRVPGAARSAAAPLAFLAAVMLVVTGFSATEAPGTVGLPPAALVATRAQLVRGDAPLSAVRRQLGAEADALLAQRAASVLDKTRTAASGDRHDYFSFAPYWWPDPTRPDGLPYVRRDGEVNPASREGTDRTAFAQLCTAVETLGLAYWFLGDERYARQAARLTRVWFLAAATRMNPNLEHAQAIPGLNHGRGIGIIEARGLINLVDGVALIAGSPAWPAADAAALRTWLADYCDWLGRSQHGRDEAAAENNHGSWYDAQAASLALALGRTDEARKILAAVPTKRIARQIEPDGRQPLELARTRSLNYSLFNLEALVLLAGLGDRLGVDSWSFVTADGRSLRAALRHVAPYADPAKPWLKEDLDRADRARIPPLLAAALAAGEDPALRAPLARFAAEVRPEERWRLWLPIAR